MANNGLGAKTYAADLKAATNEKSLSENKASLKLTKEQRAASLALLRSLRALHVEHIGTQGVGQVTAAIRELEYTLSAQKSYITDYETRIARLEGTTPAADEDDE